jgi:hypothetical protein
MSSTTALRAPHGLRFAGDGRFFVRLPPLSFPMNHPSPCPTSASLLPSTGPCPTPFVCTIALPEPEPAPRPRIQPAKYAKQSKAYAAESRVLDDCDNGPVTVDITARRGGLLGNLLCGLLHGGGGITLGTTLGELIDALLGNL